MTSIGFYCSLLLTLLTFSGTALHTHAAPVAPSNCVAAGMGISTGAAGIAIKWQDNSTNETSWRIEISLNNGASYTFLGNIASTNPGGTGGTQDAFWSNGVSGNTYKFRVFAYDGQSSAASNVASVTPELFSLTASLVPNQAAVNLSWPTVQNASSFEIWRAVPGGSWIYMYSVAGTAGGELVTPPDIGAGNSYFFKVRPVLGARILGESNLAGVAVNVITSKTGTSGTPGSPFSHQFTHITVSPVIGLSLTYNGQTTLPPGLVFNSGSGLLSGVYPAKGNYTLVYKESLANGTQVIQNFSIRVRPMAGAPLLGSAIPDWSAMAGSSRDTDLAGTFTDPEAESAVRVSTTLGDMDFILFDTATPATVANFMNYASAGKYTGVAFHRSTSDFVVQGGGLKGTGSGSSFNSLVTLPPVVNEPGVANVRGTVSMAKVGGDADSATSQFFVNMKDNRANLDYQNGGFTVFGRVAGDGMAVADAINDLPSRSYSLYVDGSVTPSVFDNFPMNAPSAPAVMDQTKVVKIQSVSSIPTMSYSIAGNTNPSVATASVVGGQLHLEGLAGGHTTITVTATDLDHLTNAQDVEVHLSDTYGTWASRTTIAGGQNGAGQNPDGDVLTNLQEYAFMEDPAVSSQNPMPVAGVAGVSPAPQFMTLTFPVRKFTTGLSYAVEAGDSLSGNWTTVWTSADGFEHAQVVAVDDLADRTVVTIKDEVPLGGQSRRFLRTRVVQE